MDNSKSELVAKIRQKFEALESTCMSRYDAREEHIVSTLSYCMSVLEQLHSWAVFGIFPTDEDDADKYIGFVQQRFQCVIDPLRLIMKVTQEVSGSAEQHSLKPKSPKSLNPGEARVSPGKLRDRVDSMTTQYLHEGRNVHKMTMNIIQKCRKDIRVIYRWGQASLMDLHDVLDEPLAEELYFMVRGKMARVLSVISLFDEVSKNVEKSFTEDTSKTCLQQSPNNTNAGSSHGDSKNSSLSSNSEMLLALKDLEDSGSGFAMKQDADDGESVDSNTPEPPTSPRPKGLLNHPKILKDQLLTHSLSNSSMESESVVH
ncbi:hypothetical protein CAPTEDRAFT_215348 [Capitella teleta]|uniref:Uncharacterized protein n=1 Tax=Capitella teleta TaxID=283909 RepID=R7UY81_CAPTE|nr:hypothetical protein CAPTEDRAFT_215348 [Capitella teleta]|eukprot:ELU11538.1 hypothetical protein CAPTEDRAFT_215348 [Capitella teleta]